MIQNYFGKLPNKFTTLTNPPAVYQLLKCITNLLKAEMLNLYFSSQTRVDDTNKDLPLLEPAVHSLNSIEISIQDVTDVLLHLNMSKASGHDLISPRLLKEGADILAYPFSIVFNRYLNQGYFPHSWKEDNVSPIFKKDD